jgi:hypothetical protein
MDALHDNLQTCPGRGYTCLRILDYQRPFCKSQIGYVVVSVFNYLLLCNSSQCNGPVVRLNAPG